MIMLQFDKRIAMNPSLQPARSLVTPEVMQFVKEGTFTLPAFHALITALATENIPTTLPARSISQDTAIRPSERWAAKGFKAKAAGEREAEMATSRPAVLAAALAEAMASRPAVPAAALAEAVASRPAVPAAVPASVVVARQAAAAAGATVVAPEELQPALHAAALQTKQHQHRANQA